MGSLPLLYTDDGAIGPELAQLNDPTYDLVLSDLDPQAIAALTNEVATVESATKLDEMAKTRLREIKGALTHLQESLQANLVKVTNAIVGDVVMLQASNIGSFLTRQKSYISADFGILYSFDAEQGLPYLGTNVYFRPVNKQAPLTGWSPWKRLGATIGLTLGEFDTDRAEPLFSSQNLLTGVGFRVTEAIRLGGGVVFFREKSADSLSTEKVTVFSPYASVSFDADVQALVNWFTKLWN